MEDQKNNICDQSYGENNNHIELCEYNIVQCKRCLISVEKGSLPSHTRDYCIVNEISCKYSFCGCNEKFLKIDAEQHFKKDHSKYEKIHLNKLSEMFENQNWEKNEMDWGDNELNYEVLWNYIKKLEKKKKELKKFKDEEYKNGLYDVKHGCSNKKKKIEEKYDELYKYIKKKEIEDGNTKNKFEIAQIEKLKELTLSTEKKIESIRNEFLKETKQIKRLYENFNYIFFTKVNGDNDLHIKLNASLNTQEEEIDKLNETIKNNIIKKLSDLNDSFVSKELENRISINRLTTNTNTLYERVESIETLENKIDSIRNEFSNETNQIKKQQDKLNNSFIKNEKEYILKNQFTMDLNTQKQYIDEKIKDIDLNHKKFSTKIQNQLFTNCVSLVLIVISYYLIIVK